MPVNFEVRPFVLEAPQIVFRFGRYYLTSNRWTPEGAVTEEVEFRDWNLFHDLILPLMPEVTPLTAETPVDQNTDVVAPTSTQSVVVNGRLDDGSTHSLLDLYDARDAYLSVPHSVFYEQRLPLQQAWDNVIRQIWTDTHSELSDCWGGRTDFVGGSGNDTLDLYGGSGVHFSGGAGNDRLYVAHGDGILMDGGAGNDQLNIWSGDNVQFTGGAGNDYLSIELGGHNVSMTGGDGNDELDITSGSHVNFSGGSGDDILHVGYVEWVWVEDEDSESVIDGGSGNDQLEVENGTNTLMTGGEGNDRLTVSWGDNLRVNGGEGNDIITVYGGNGGQIHGDDGNDLITLFLAREFQLDAGAGDDFIIAGYGGGTVRGGAGNDVICGDALNVWRRSPLPFDLMRWELQFTEQGADTYVFEQGSGHDTIRDFMIESEEAYNNLFTPLHDRIDISDYHFDDFNAVLAASAQRSNGVLISLDANDSVLLTGISLSMLTAQNFIL